jgi:predicted nucleotidyltransferase
VGAFEVFKKKRPIDESSLEEATQYVIQALKENLEALVLYGSYLTSDYVPGKSDVNLLVILKEEENIEKISGLSRYLISKGFALPLVISKFFILSSLDTFPLEYLVISNPCRILFGTDFIKKLKIDPIDLRRQLEREIKSKYLLLKNIYIRNPQENKLLIAALIHSWRAIGAILKGIYFLKRSELPSDVHEVFNGLQEALGIDISALKVGYLLKKGEVKMHRRDVNKTFVTYVEALDSLGRAIDRMEVKHER